MIMNPNSILKSKKILGYLELSKNLILIFQVTKLFLN
jgi:hypothetical protein